MTLGSVFCSIKMPDFNFNLESCLKKVPPRGYLTVADDVTAAIDESSLLPLSG